MARTVELENVTDLTGNDAEIDAIQADVGAGADTSLLGDLYSILGNPATSLTDQLAALNDVSSADVETACSASLATYDPATGAEAAAIQAVVDSVQDDVTVVMSSRVSTLTETGGTLTTDGTEQTIFISNAPAGIYRPIILRMDYTNHTAGETVVLRVYYRIKSGGNLIKQDEDTLAGVQDPALIKIDLDPDRYGCQITIEKTVGTNRAYDWQVFYKV